MDDERATIDPTPTATDTNNGAAAAQGSVVPAGSSAKGSTPRRKIPAEWVPSDDCVVYRGRVIEEGNIIVQGTPHYIHQGEWVEVLPVGNMREFLAVSKLGAAFGDIGRDMMGSAMAAGLAEKALDDICDVLAERVLSWTWTDNDFHPLSPPFRNRDVFRHTIGVEELLWLVGAIQGETKGQEKNA